MIFGFCAKTLPKIAATPYVIKEASTGLDDRGEASAEGCEGLCGGAEALGGGAFVCMAWEEQAIE